MALCDDLRKLRSLLDAATKRRGALLLLLMAGGALLEVVGVGSIPVFVALLAEPERVRSVPWVAAVLGELGLRNERELLFWGSLAMFGVFVVKNTYLAVMHYLKARFVARVSVNLAERVFSAYLLAPYTFHLDHRYAEVLSNAVDLPVRIASSVLMNLLTIAMTSLMTAAILGLLFAVEPVVTLVAIGMLSVASGFFLQRVRRKIVFYGVENRNRRYDTLQAVNQGLGGFKEARVLGREPYFIDRMVDSAKRTAAANMYSATVAQLPRSIIETVAVGGMLLISLLLIVEGRPMSSVVPVLALFGAAAMRLMPAVYQIMTLLTTLGYQSAIVNPIHRDLSLLERPGGEVATMERARSDRRRLSLDHAIELRGVSFRYSGSAQRALDNVTVTIPAGMAVAFVGPSGAGKSTIADVLLGLLEPEQGKIVVDGLDVRTDLRAWQNNIGYVPQQIFLMDDTIRRNIAFGVADKTIDVEGLWRAVEAAHLSEFIAGIPEGLDTMVGERGVRISGGQRQRIGIARALYHGPQVLIMDEATASLDNITESYVIQAIDRLRGDRTVIMIAHRLSTVRNCDLIFFLDKGKVVASGSYSQLLDSCPTFCRMADSTGSGAPADAY